MPKRISVRELEKQEAVAAWENLLETGRQLSKIKQVEKSVLETLEEKKADFLSDKLACLALDTLSFGCHNHN